MLLHAFLHPSPSVLQHLLNLALLKMVSLRNSESVDDVLFASASEVSFTMSTLLFSSTKGGKWIQGAS